MRPLPSTLLMLPLLWLSLAAAPAAQKGKEPLDAPPQLLPTKGRKPKWTTVEQLKQFAAKGDPQACFELADRSIAGDGVPVDIQRAVALFEQAAKGGVVNGWFRLGKIYHDGLLDEPDYGRALDYFTIAARAGVTEAQHNIGAMLVSARGVRRDYVEGLAWLIVAGQSGDTSEAETQVRQRLAKRPADIAAAEARAAEITKDLPSAAVRAVRLGAPAPVTESLKPPPSSMTPVPLAKPAVVAPAIDPPPISVPLTPPVLPSVPDKP